MSRARKLFTRSEQALQLELLDKVLRLSPKQRLCFGHLRGDTYGQFAAILVEVPGACVLEREDPRRLVPDTDWDRQHRWHRRRITPPRKPVRLRRGSERNGLFRPQHRGQKAPF